MAKSKKEDELIDLQPDINTPRPRLHKLIIKNFRSIGTDPVEIDLDDIVVLVGPNNSGKSSILRAYEVAMSQGSNKGKLSIDDFPNGVVDEDCYPEIELHTIVFTNAPGKKWLDDLGNQEYIIRERWIWSSPNKDPKRQGFNIELNDWDEEKVPWGAPNVANSRRPLPHRVDAFDTPDAQAKSITDLIAGILKDKIIEIKSDPSQEISDYELILDKIRNLQTKAVKATESEIIVIESEITKYIEKLFPNHQVKFDAKAETDIEKAYEPFKSRTEMLIGPKDGYFSKIEHQGSGARRTILWATLKYISENKNDTKERPHVLLLDEPEICLHPSAIREARSVLYDLPKSGNWQVMLTSHSPIFIDLSRDNTTIIRVFRDEMSSVQSTTLYRPSKAKLSHNDLTNLKLLNICDPYVHEFFFGGKQIIVEGDTEYTAFSMIKEQLPDEYLDLQIIRARGKGIIPSVAKVLLQFSKGFSILHDTDTPKTKDNKNNPAWGMNSTIGNILSLENALGRVHLLACKTNFESAIFGEEIKNEKPYNALIRIRSDQAIFEKVKLLLDALIDNNVTPPSNIIRWNSIADLESQCGLK
ncbi:ATP-dependent nuclease [Leptonema illini]|uniref:SMC domain protein n=1 Tax=Leptonema illini DSM 21528 TaxID=929563 RepID=H2CKW7_9LEPT|nr:AAA family ATPase [Leptonema illini]EHQ06201.1 SMC domain protein [Leptonema illini DSM 21528]